jgi:hypothetical protein
MFALQHLLAIFRYTRFPAYRANKEGLYHQFAQTELLVPTGCPAFRGSRFAFIS